MDTLQHLLNVSPDDLEAQYQSGDITAADLREFGPLVASYGPPELLARVLSLADYDRQWFLNIYREAVNWLQTGNVGPFDTVSQYYRSLPASEQYDLGLYLSRNNLPLPGNTQTPGPIECQISTLDVPAGQPYTQCTFKTPHTFSLQADQAWFGVHPRVCPFCKHPVPAQVYVNPVTPVVPTQRTYRRPGQLSN